MNKNKILHIKYIDNLTFTFNDNNNNIKYEELNDFELYSIHKENGDNNKIKIINIKTYLNKINNINNNMDNNSEVKYDQKELDDQKIINMKLINEINTLKNQLDKLETKFDKLKGRFIFKAFIDYIYILFNINIDLKNSIKASQLKIISQKKGYDISYILPIIKSLEILYHNESEESHKIPKKEEIKGIILAQFDEEEDRFIFELFEKLHPENIIQKIIEKNNDLTKLFISNPSQDDREQKKSLIVSEINGIISSEDKNKSIKIIKQIIDDCKKKEKYYDEYYDDYNDEYDDEY